MDGLVRELLRLESAKHKALIEIDPQAYDAHVESQLHLVSTSKSASTVTSLSSLLSLSQLIALNTSLLKDLRSTSREPSCESSKNRPKRKAASQCR
jgi:hypothetical protein